MYFDWIHFPFRLPPEMKGESPLHDVAVVGAGPVGLALTLALARQGIRAVVLEPRDSVSDGSRAIGMQRRSAQFFDAIGIGDRFLEKAQPRRSNSVHHGHRRLYRTVYERAASERHHEIYTLQQCWTEQLLLDELQRHEGVDLRWHSRVTGVLNSHDEVHLTVETPEGPYTLRARQVVAADGARGPVRKLLGAPSEATMPAYVSDRAFVISDFRLDAELSDGRSLYLDPDHQPGGAVILHRQPFNVWRLDYAVPDEVDPTEEARPDAARARIAAHLDMIGVHASFELLWSSVYRPRARSLCDYRHGRVFFVGDAAHPHPIFGGRGLNHGLADAFNLAWKLALSARGLAGPALLDSYDQERRPLVLKSFQSLTQNTCFMTQPTAGLRTMRKAALALAPTEAFVAGLFDAYKAPRAERLASNLHWDAGPDSPVGDPLRDALLHTPDGSATHLHTRLQGGFNAIVLVRQGRCPPDVVRVLEHLTQGELPFSWMEIAAPGAPAGAALVAADTGLFDEHGIVDFALCLVRPDHHIAAWFGASDALQIDQALRRAAGWTSGAPPAPGAPVPPAAFEQIAQAIDRCDEAEAPAFLARLALILCSELSDPHRVTDAVRRASVSPKTH